MAKKQYSTIKPSRKNTDKSDDSLLLRVGMFILLIIMAPLCILFLGIMGWLRMFED